MCSFQPLTVSDLKDVIDDMNSKTCDLDPLPANLVLRCLDVLWVPLLHIVNLSLATDVVPHILKNACVVPLLKRQSLNSDVMGNYRPVSNLSYVSKVIEKYVYRQVIVDLESNSLLDRYQSAYEANHSCETALVKIHNDIITLLDSKLNVVLIVFDLSAAFNTVHHKLLMYS